MNVQSRLTTSNAYALPTIFPDLWKLETWSARNTYLPKASKQTQRSTNIQYSTRLVERPYLSTVHTDSIPPPSKPKTKQNKTRQDKIQPNPRKLPKPQLVGDRAIEPQHAPAPPDSNKTRLTASRPGPIPYHPLLVRERTISLGTYLGIQRSRGPMATHTYVQECSGCMLGSRRGGPVLWWIGSSNVRA